jgi:hypothetical protein
MNFKWDLKKPLADLKRKISTSAVLRKRSKDSIARPKAEKNILSKDSRMQKI